MTSIPVATQNQSFDWLMNNNRQAAHRVANLTSHNDLLYYVGTYQDAKLLDICLKKDKNVDIDNLYGVLKTALDSVYNYKNKSQTEKNVSIKKREIEINYDLVFYEKVFQLIDQHITCADVRKKVAKKIFEKLHMCFSKCVVAYNYEKNKENNLKQFEQLLQLSSQYALNVTNEQLLLSIPKIVNNFSDIEQWEILLLDKTILTAQDNNKNNFLHYFCSYLGKVNIQERREVSIKLFGNDDYLFEDPLEYFINYTGIKSSYYSFSNHQVNTTPVGDSDTQEKYMDFDSSSVYATDTEKFLNDFFNQLEQLPNFEQCLKSKNNDNQTPFDMANNQYINYIKKIMLEKRLNPIKQDTQKIKSKI